MKSDVIIDTSIWIWFFNRPDSSEKKQVDRLLDQQRVVLTGVVLAELLQGAKSQKDMTVLQQHLMVLPFLESSYQSWKKAGEISQSLRKTGITVPLTDCLIASVALQYHCLIYTLDEHFRHIKHLTLYA